MKSSISYLGLALALATPLASGTQSQYAGQQHRPIKALSAEDIADYRHGRGMGTAKAAELNGYPGPMHVIELVGQLKLSNTQLEQARAVQRNMAENAQRLGRAIVEKEDELDALYAQGKATREATHALVSAIGQLQAQYRLVHLDAHLPMRELLTPEQLAAYDRLRGYAGAQDRSNHSGTKPAHGGQRH